MPRQTMGPLSLPHGDEILSSSLISQLRHIFSRGVPFSDKLDVMGIISYSVDGNQEQFVKVNFSFNAEETIKDESFLKINSSTQLIEAGSDDNAYTNIDIRDSLSQPSESPPLLAPLTLNVRCSSTPPNDNQHADDSAQNDMLLKYQDRRDRRKSSKPRKQFFSPENVHDEADSVNGSLSENPSDESINAKRPRLATSGVDSARILCPSNLNIKHEPSSILIPDANSVLNSQSIRLCCVPSQAIDLQNVLSGFNVERTDISATSKPVGALGPSVKQIFPFGVNLASMEIPTSVQSQNSQNILKDENSPISDMVNKQNLENMYPMCVNASLSGTVSSAGTSTETQTNLLTGICERPGQSQKSSLLGEPAAIVQDTSSNIRSSLSTQASNSSHPLNLPSVSLATSVGEVVGSIPHSVIASALLNGSLNIPGLGSGAESSSSGSSLNAPLSVNSIGNIVSHYPNLVRCSTTSPIQNTPTAATQSPCSPIPISIAVSQAPCSTLPQVSQATPVFLSQQPTFTLIGSLPSSLASFSNNIPATILSINNVNTRNSLGLTNTQNGSTISASVSTNVSAIAALLRGLAQLKQPTSDPACVVTAAGMTENCSTEMSILSTSADSGSASIPTSVSNVPCLMAESVATSTSQNPTHQTAVDINALAAAVAAVTGVFPRNPTITPGPLPGSILLSCTKPNPNEKINIGTIHSTNAVNVNPDSVNQNLRNPAGVNIGHRPILRTNSMQPATTNLSIAVSVANKHSHNEASPSSATERNVALSSKRSPIASLSATVGEESTESTIDRILETIRGQMRASDSSKNKAIAPNGIKKLPEVKSADLLLTKSLVDEVKGKASEANSFASNSNTSMVSRLHCSLKKANGKLAPVAPNPSTRMDSTSHAPLVLSRSSSTSVTCAVGSSSAAVGIGVESLHTKVYKCRYCGKTFNRKFCRERHERLHTGVKPYTCEVCDEKFIRLEDKKRHVRSILHTTRTAALACVNGKILPVDFDMQAHLDCAGDDASGPDEPEGTCDDVDALSGEDEYKENSPYESQLCIADDEEIATAAEISDASEQIETADQQAYACDEVATGSPSSPPSFKHSRRSALKQYVTPIRLPANIGLSLEASVPTETITPVTSTTDA